MGIKELFRFRLDPSDPKARHAGDMVWESAMLSAPNPLEILGSEKRIAENGEVQYLSFDEEEEVWVALGRVYPHQLS